MENKKMTKKQIFAGAIELLENIENVNVEIIEGLKHEIDLLDRKNSKSTQTKNQVENENIKTDIVNALTEIAKPVTITELQSANETMANFSNQKLSALLKQLVESNQVVKTTDKKKSYFTVA
jgi:hypothetical protein